jgi:hypothetical protein
MAVTAVTEHNRSGEDMGREQRPWPLVSDSPDGKDRVARRSPKTRAARAERPLGPASSKPVRALGSFGRARDALHGERRGVVVPGVQRIGWQDSEGSS